MIQKTLSKALWVVDSECKGSQCIKIKIMNVDTPPDEPLNAQEQEHTSH